MLLVKVIATGITFSFPPSEFWLGDVFVTQCEAIAALWIK